MEAHSQISFERGHFIDNSDQKVECLIKNIDWKDNPTEFEYKLSENTEPRKASIESVKEFEIYSASRYVRHRVNIDRSSEMLSQLTSFRKPVFQEEVLFLKILVEGDASLFLYADGNLQKYFYKHDSSTVEQLIFKKYKTPDNQINENNRFRQQLWNDLKCPTLSLHKVENLGYNKKELTNFFIKHNQCKNSDFTSPENQDRDLFNLTARPGIYSSSLSIQNYYLDSRSTVFGSKPGLRFGLELEFILPYNKNKWALLVEPTFQSFKAEATDEANDIKGGKINKSINYQSLELPLSLRHYFFLNEKSKVFINASYIFDFPFHSSIEFTRSDESVLYSLDIVTNNNFSMGVGYEYNNRYSIELRYHTSREVLFEYVYWGSNYQTSSIILGYTLF